MPISQRDEADLIWYFGEGQATFRRSTFGTLLERAQNLSFDSTGARIPRGARHDWHVVPISTTHAEPSYTPEDWQLVRAAGVSRRLRRMKEEHAAVMELHYGDIGARWSRTRAGRIFALYAVTEAGQRYLSEKGPADLRPDERLGLLATSQAQHPTPTRRQLLLVMHSQATRLLARAADAWEEAAGRAA